MNPERILNALRDSQTLLINLKESVPTRLKVQYEVVTQENQDACLEFQGLTLEDVIKMGQNLGNPLFEKP